MSNKLNFIMKLFSKIDDDIIDRNTEKRAQLMARISKRSARKLWIPIVSVAACLVLVFGALFGWLLLGGGGKQVPIYQGMTVSYDAPVVTAPLSAKRSNTITLSTTVPLDDSNKAHTNEGHKHGGNDLDASVDGKYYAMKNENIYIHVHLSNPDEFEILSFTLNGVKYSSYMFEEGSDLENLILKYNVGEAEGLQEYTIDAIKYVDGEKIKDVRMEGDQTIEVVVNSDNQAVRFNARLNGWDLSIAPQWTTNVGGFTSLAIYDGSQKVASYSPTATVFRNLPAGKKLVLIGTYSSGGKTETAAYVFQTPKVSEGLLVNGGVIVGIGSCTDNVLYLNQPIADGAFTGNKNIKTVCLGNGVTEIGEGAFSGCASLQEVVMTDNLKTIADNAFSDCISLESITIPDSVTTLGNRLFDGCTELSSVVIGRGVTKMDVSGSGLHVWNPETGDYRPIPGVGLFTKCPALSVVTFRGTKQQWLTITEGLEGIADQVKTITIRCSDGDLLLVPNPQAIS